MELRAGQANNTQRAVSAGDWKVFVTSALFDEWAAARWESWLGSCDNVGSIKKNTVSEKSEAREGSLFGHCEYHYLIWVSKLTLP